MNFEAKQKQLSGTAVPLSALRSTDGFGIGEYPDLGSFARFCKQAGLSVLQILPVNDTGGDSSPYSTLSAFALHPVYLRLDTIEGSGPVLAKYRGLRAQLQESRRVKYNKVLETKAQVLREIFSRQKKPILASDAIAGFLQQNPWVKIYAVYKVLKEQNGQKAWTEWSSYRDIEVDTLNDIFNSLRDAAFFHVWVQHECAKQLSRAAWEIDGLGLYLKGDLPILLNEDSADVWFHRHLFDTSQRAGAPPDMFSDDGQNWGFPIYNWQEMKKDGYAWWKRRVQFADTYYHAYRLDHILGFFRIWAIPRGNHSGILGSFHPVVYITDDDLHERGFDKERIKWLSRPHVEGNRIRSVFREETDDALAALFERIDNEDLFLFKPEMSTEQAIYNTAFSDQKKAKVIDWFHDRALIAQNRGTYTAAWNFHSSTSFNSLNEKEKQKFQSLVHTKGHESENLWEALGEEHIRAIQHESDMLICGEDLGVVPACVPKVMERLGILGLRIVRWTRYYDKPGSPLIPLDKYPEATVATLSVHDTTTMRQEWNAEHFDKSEFAGLTGIKGPVPSSYSVDFARKVIQNISRRLSSRLCIFQIQELFAMDEALRTADAEEERINIPGTTRMENWSYRLPVNVKNLLSNSRIISTIKVKTARQEPISKQVP